MEASLYRCIDETFEYKNYLYLVSRFQCYHGTEISQHDLRITLVKYVDDLTWYNPDC